METNTNTGKTGDGIGLPENSQLSLFGEDAPIKARHPKQGTLAYRCLAILLTGERMTHPGFEGMTGSWRLAAYVELLHRLGWPVRSDKIKLEGRKRPISLYWMPAQVIHYMEGNHHANQ